MLSEQFSSSLAKIEMNQKPGFYVDPPKINIEPENDGLEDVSPFPGVYSQVPC